MITTPAYNGESKLVLLSRQLPELRESVERAERDYRELCAEIGLPFHLSQVHSFDDTVAQAYIVAVSGTTQQQKYNLASVAFMGHALDDLVDTDDGITTRLPAFDGNISYAREKLSPQAATVIDWILSLSADNQKELGAGVVANVIYGSLIQRSKTRLEQKGYAKSFKGYILGALDSTSLQEDVSRLHPMQIWLTTSIGMRTFFELDGTKSIPVAILYDLVYAPLLYCHDRDQETKGTGESFVLRYGQELCEEGYISNGRLLQFVDIFEEHLAEIDDPRRKQHSQQLYLVYKTFEPVLPEPIKQRYKQLISGLR